MSKPSLSIIVPCYNEQDNIPFIIKKFLEILRDKNFAEILLVNNGSTDNSSEIFKKELISLPNHPFKLVEIEKNKGYGFGILAGLEKAQGKVLSWTHADLQTDPEDVLAAYAKYSNTYTIIKGTRRNRKLTEKILSLGMQIIVFFVLKVWLTEINAQPKLFSRKFYDKYIKDKAPHDFSLDLYLLYQAKINGYKILETPVHFKDRIYGKAKGGSGSDWKTRIKLIKRTLQYIFELRSKLK